MGFLFEVMELSWNWIVMMVVQLGEYTKKNTELHTLRGREFYGI